MEEPQWGKLGDAMRQRRAELRLSTRKAALAAGIDWNTWGSAEKGNRIRDAGFPGIEEALGWSPGSVRAVLAGGEPSPAAAQGHGSAYDATVPVASGAARAGLKAEATGGSGPAPTLADAVDQISQLHNIPVEERLRMVQRLVEMHKEATRARSQAASQ